MKPGLILESLLLYIAPPLLIVMGLLPAFTVMPLLWIGLIYTYLVLHKSDEPTLSFRIDRSFLRYLLIRFFLLGFLLLLFVWVYYPETIFQMLLERPGLWVLILLLYPLLSALVQEIVFRAFFFYRFAPFLKKKWKLLIVNAALFSYVHIVFWNPVAVIFSFIGGLLFMSTYLKTRSVAMSTLEHALFGDLIFTLGIGHFFYHAG